MLWKFNRQREAFGLPLKEGGDSMSSWRERPAPIPKEELVSEEETDIVIVGLGYAGTAALREAAEQGASVIGLELQRRDRYISFGRDIGHINSAFLKSRGVPEVDPIDLYNEMLRRACNRVNPSLVMQFAQNCGMAFDWFTDSYGVDGLKDVHVAFWPKGADKFKSEPGASYSGYHFWNGTAQFPEPRGWKGSPTLTDVVIDNQRKAEKLGARLRFEHRAVQPVLEGRRVVGVIALGPDKAYHLFLARKGVLLSAGGFTGNREMMEDLVTDITDLLRPDQDYPRMGGQKGLGHQIGVWAGGRLEQRPLPVMGGNYPMMKGFTTFGVLWLDSRGKRFCNETLGGSEISSFPGAQMSQGTYYSVYDEHILEDLDWAVPAHGGFDAMNPNSLPELEKMLKLGAEDPCCHGDTMASMKKAFPYGYVSDKLYSGMTPEELADNAGLTGTVKENLVRSIRRYQEICRKGRDDDFGKDAKLLRPLEGRLYLHTTEFNGDFGFMLTTVGGFVTDESQNVLDAFYEPIPGLYASGNCCGRRFGPAYTTPIAGVSIGMAMTLGREAGRAMAALAPDQNT